MLFNNKGVVMTGERLKTLLSTYKVSQSEIARKLGLSQQSFNQMLSASDVKTSLLERISNVIGVPISRLYDAMCCPPSASDDEIYGTQPDKSQKKESESVKDERIKLLEDQVAFLKEQVDFYKNKNMA